MLELKSQTYLHDIKLTAQSRFCRTETISRCVSKQICYFKSCVPFSNHYSESRRLELQKSVLNCFLNSTLWILQYFRKKVNGVYHNLCTATNYGTFSFKNPLKPYAELTSKDNFLSQPINKILSRTSSNYVYFYFTDSTNHFKQHVFFESIIIVTQV